MVCNGPPKWHYNGPSADSKCFRDGDDGTRLPELEGEHAVDLGTYARLEVSNVDAIEKETATSKATATDEEALGRAYFDLGLRHLLSYQHEMASKCFLASIRFSSDCALAHALVSLCHSPNYNFKGDAYYDSTHNPEEADWQDHLCVFPSQQLASRYSKLAVEKVEQIRKLHRKGGGKRGKKNKGRKGTVKVVQTTDNGNTNTPTLVTDVEAMLVTAIRVLTCNPGVDAGLADELVGRPYATAMRKVYERYPDDPEVAYFFCESLMVLNAWKLYEYPTGKPLSNDVIETRGVLEASLQKHKGHAGLCHLYVHLMEMSSEPERALEFCGPLRYDFKMAGHLIHMPTHIDVLVGDYEQCVRDNCRAAVADSFSLVSSPDTAGPNSFYFGYIVHNYHFAVYGAILGAMEGKAMEVATELEQYLTEDLFAENPDLTAYLEAYSALKLHVMVRFGRWRELLEVKPPRDKRLMFFRSATLAFAKGLAYANLGDIDNAKREADRYNSIRKDPIADDRILHNNIIRNLLAVDAPMLAGEIAYKEGRYSEAFDLLRKAVRLQDELNYDEPWGKMQPIRHALGGLLLERGHLTEAAGVFRTDLRYHPKNPFALVGLIQCLERKLRSGLLDKDEHLSFTSEVQELHSTLSVQRTSEWADFKVQVACACCTTQDDQCCA